MGREFLAEDDFAMCLGDNFIVGSIAGLVDEFRATHPEAQIMLTRVTDPRDFGVAEIDHTGKVISLVAKPRRPRTDLAMVGAYVFRSRVHEAVQNLESSWRGDLEITESLPVACRPRLQRPVHGHL